jgi:hypothetical protein
LNLLDAGFRPAPAANPAAFSSPHGFSSGNPYLFCNSAQRVETLVRVSGLKLATYQLNRTDLATGRARSASLDTHQGEEEK